MRKVTTLLSTLALATTLLLKIFRKRNDNISPVTDATIWLNGTSFVTDGRNSGKWTKIGVPSCWELQGFGTYQYGITFYGKAFPKGVADEKRNV